MSYILNNIKISPLKGLNKLTITSGFGTRSFYNTITKKQESGVHNGLDMVGALTIVAPASGKVSDITMNIILKETI